MAELLADLLADARARWMIGGDAPAPAHPLTDGTDSPEADLRLLAVAGQYQRLRLRSVVPDLTRQADLPTLALPVLPDALRPIARRLLTRSKETLWQTNIARLTAARGYLLHPADWMPPPNAEDLPDAYAPLQHWQAGNAETPEDLTSETWDDFGRAERRQAIVMLRHHQPEMARTILEDRLSACPADERTRLVEALAYSLGADDAPFLEGLASDRSEKVRQAAARLLSRLGKLTVSGEETAEAAEMFEVATTGLLRRGKAVRLRKGLKAGQLKRLGVILPGATLEGLARAMDLTAAEFVARWDSDTSPDNVLWQLAGVVAETGSEADITVFWQRVRETSSGAATAFMTLAPRMAPQDRDTALITLIGQLGENTADIVLRITGPSVSPSVGEALAASRAAKDLSALVRSAADTTPEKANAARLAEMRLGRDLEAFGLLLPAALASEMADRMIRAGLHPADPKLDLLRFNAALKG